MPFNFNSLRILIIEDNPGDFVLIKELFTEEIKDPEISHCRTFAQAKEILLENDDFDAILLDLSLPDSSGEKLVHEIMNMAGQVPVIVLTGYEDKEFGIKTLSLGISDYLLKNELSSSILLKSLAYSIERNRIGNQLKEAEEQRKKHDIEITKAIITAQERERMEIGSELHDNVNQLLLASKINLRLARDEQTLEQALEWIRNSSDYINLAIEEIRNLSHQLAPRVFLKDSLIEAVRNLLNSIISDKRYKVELTYNSFDESLLREDLKLNLYRMLQEQVKNVIKYSEATLVEVNLNMEENRFRMRIFDNGKGFDVNKIKPGIGLSNIKQRTELFFGDFFLKTSNGKGCEIIVEIPITRDPVKP